MRIRSTFVLAALILAVTSASAQAQVIGTFFWRLAPLGSVLNVTITQKGGLFVLEGFETQCGGNLSLPLTGMAIPQANGTIFMGMTSINETGSGLHTRAYISAANNFSGTWADNTGYFNQAFTFVSSGAPVCPGGLRTGPTSGAPAPGAGEAAKK
jgi:hypothetical protein